METEIVEVMETVTESAPIELMSIVALICAVYVVFNLYFLFEKFRIKE